MISRNYTAPFALSPSINSGQACRRDDIELHWDADFRRCTQEAIFSSFGQVYVFKILKIGVHLRPKWKFLCYRASSPAD